MWVESSYVFFSLLLMVYCVWRFLTRKEKAMLYFALCFVFLTLSISLQAVVSLGVVYGTQPLTIVRLVELGGLAMFAGFVITFLMAMRSLTKS
jgi:hypothetical protein